MSTLVHRFVLAGVEEDVPLARHKVIDRMRGWGLSTDDDAADTVRLIASELVTNAVVHGKGPVTVTLFHRPGRLVIDVFDTNPAAPQMSWAQDDDENGRGLAMVDRLALHCSWMPSGRGKRVWAEIELPMVAPAIRAAVLSRFFGRGPKNGIVAATEPLTLAVA
ncbi:ATP-binding protein [Streptomyces acidiscabies]|uniref:ATP-binding protein n=1 Tax=Streptomyces acidiscabies TaxID=42234 RepID=A0AAP6ELC9_9ACTN|nr:ATP-binding protein [Streptomyces acidiscabies]MDX2967172.1 ATP-binding protein [Streptomyces acidiscabies]MDX3025424.1 ATP-binding protein [Streptomyces acidiscabies]MDX3795988.1 ATP-binding protein [Streptomyces acidiscabies]